MDSLTTYTVDPSKQYADIIVPTLDTVRGSFMIELLLTNDKQVSPPPTYTYIQYMYNDAWNIHVSETIIEEN